MLETVWTAIAYEYHADKNSTAEHRGRRDSQRIFIVGGEAASNKMFFLCESLCPLCLCG